MKVNKENLFWATMVVVNIVVYTLVITKPVWLGGI